jgi:hypothetical protein
MELHHDLIKKLLERLRREAVLVLSQHAASGTEEGYWKQWSGKAVSRLRAGSETCHIF